MTPQNRLVVLTYLITIKVIEFQNLGEQGAERSPSNRPVGNQNHDDDEQVGENNAHTFDSFTTIFKPPPGCSSLRVLASFLWGIFSFKAVNEKEPPRGCRSFHVPAEQVIIRIWVYETAKGINRYFKFCSNPASSVRAKGPRCQTA